MNSARTLRIMAFVSAAATTGSIILYLILAGAPQPGAQSLAKVVAILCGLFALCAVGFAVGAVIQTRRANQFGAGPRAEARRVPRLFSALGTSLALAIVTNIALGAFILTTVGADRAQAYLENYLFTGLLAAMVFFLPVTLWKSLRGA